MEATREKLMGKKTKIVAVKNNKTRMKSSKGKNVKPGC